MGRNTLYTLAFSSLIAASTSAQTTPNTDATSDPTSNLKTLLQDKQYDTVDSLIIIKNNNLLFEQYANGYSKQKTHQIASITKSISSLLVGIAIDKGYLKSLDEKVYSFYEGSPYEAMWSGEKKKMRVRDLLTMQHGIACDDFEDHDLSKYNAWVNSPDKIASVLNMPSNASPGEKSSYCTASTQLLYTVLEKATRMPAQDFAKQYLFTPLGINKIEWEKVINVSPQGKYEQVALGHGAKMRPRDIAKIGTLVLNNGVWKGKKIVSSSWIEASFKGAGKVLGADYGFLWYSEPYTVDGKTINSHLAMGYGGQLLVFFPSLDAIVVMTAQDYNMQVNAYDLIGRKILPFITSL